MTTHRRTKIVCTLGPASSSPEVLSGLVDRGMDVARLNFSHGTHETHRQSLERVRAAARQAGREVAVMQDLQGPKIRVGRLQGGAMELRSGEKVFLQPGQVQPAPDVIPTTYEGLPRDVRPGDPILLADGLLRLRVEAVAGDRVCCRVEVPGPLGDHKGINLPGVAVSAPALTAKDREDLAFGARIGVDLVSLSFVRRPEDVQLARTLLDEAGSSAPVIAKIEKPEAVDALEAILDVADGIMVARGDLGVELGPEKVPLVQKRAIAEANRRGKLVITATQMLESMVHSPVPTRAEASDVANAVLDQTDAVMLSEETAAGEHPLLALETMDQIVREVEASDLYRRKSELPPVDLGISTNAIAHAAVAAASHVAARAIVCLSGHGGSPRLVSDYRPAVDIVALTRYPEVARRLAAYWGVLPVPFERAHTVEENLAAIDALLKRRGLAAPGDTVVLTFVLPTDSGEHTNALTVHRVA